MNRYEAYKNSGVEWIGEIPAGWETTVFSRACSASLGKMLTKEPKTDVSFAAPYLKAANLQEDGFALGNLQNMYFEPDEAEQYRLDKGDLLVVEGGSVGLAHVWDGSIDNCYIQNALHRVRPREGFSVQYLKYCFDIARNSGYIDLVCNKATIAHFTKEKLLATPLVVPSLAEQQAIADFLDVKTSEIDGLVADCEREVELLQEYRKAVISEAVTKGLDPNAPMKDSGVEWIGEIPAGWSAVRVDKVALRKSGHTPDKTNPDYWNGDIVWVSLADSPKLRNGRYISNSSSMTTSAGIAGSSAEILPKGAVLLSRDASVGLTAIAGVDLAVSQHFMAYICGVKLNNEFLRFAFLAMHRELEKLSMGSTIPTIGLPLIRKLSIPLPPREVQGEIVAYLDAKTAEIDSLIDAKRQLVEKLREYRKSLISEAVTGKFKVPGV